METVSVARGPAEAAIAREPVAIDSAAHAPPSAVAWGAIIGGAVGAAATSIILLSLGAGIGLSTVSPWNGEGLSAKTLGWTAVAWMVVIQWLSAALGGYITGRLRTRWNMHTDEVYFRDTVHGFLSWAFAIVIISLIASSALVSAVGGATHGAATGAAVSAQNTQNDGPVTTAVDTLFRSDNPAPNASSDDVRGETARLLTRSLAKGDVSQDDRTYLARVVAARNGVTQDAAQQRVDQVITQAKEATDTARKAAARLAIATALSLAIGAFIAAVAGGIGGRERDM